jgi:hypothetical protein
MNTDYRKLLSNYYQKHYLLSKGDSDDKASEGRIEELGNSIIAHEVLNIVKDQVRHLYLVNINELVIIRSEQKDENGEWNFII